MKNKKTTLLLALFLVLVVGGAAVLYPKLSASAPLPGAGGSSAGQSASASQPQTFPAPSFSMEDTEGNVVQLSDLLDGQPLVLNFWASTCPPCKQEMPDFQDAFDAYGSEIRFAMVNVGDAMQGETREKADAFLEESGYTFPIYFDLDYQGITTYEVRGFPHTYFIDSAGELVLYAPGMIGASALQQGLHAIAPDLVPAP